MKKMLLTLTAAGVLSLPAGIALAQDGTPEPVAPTATCVEPVRDRDRDRDRVADQDQLTVQVQEQARLRIHDGTCDGDCTGDQVRQREQVQAEDGIGTPQLRQASAGEYGRGRNS